MLVLAIDTCEARGSIAVLRDEEVLVPAVHSGDEEYSSWLLPTVEKALKEASKSIVEVDLYAVTAGPGSFTGVRIGLTTVKAWSEVFGKPIAAVSRLEVLAREAGTDTNFVAAAISAQREQIFAALYRRAGNALQLVEAEMVIAPGEFINWASEQAGAEGVAWISTDAAMIEEQEAWRGRLSRGEEILSIPCVLAPLAGKVGFRKAQEGLTVDALGLDANYVRRSYVEEPQKGPWNAPKR
jgi:tRNA threonylcarbamoyladenosine biosynthesis protein TsaB